LKYLRTCYRY